MDDQGSHGNSIGAIEKEDKEGYDVILAYALLAHPSELTSSLAVSLSRNGSTYTVKMMD